MPLTYQQIGAQQARKPYQSNRTRQPKPTTNPNQRAENVSKIARSITVRVISGDRRGSGILISRLGSTYDVITNNHVVDSSQQISKIITSDNVVHSAKIVQEVRFPNQDLTLLRFSTKPNGAKPNGTKPSRIYATAAFGNFKRLRIGQTLYAAGFANDLRLKEHERWRFVSGKYALQLTEPLEAGYSVGYSNPVQKGMSGGPVLNEWGEVIGINGRHAQPLWGNPYVFATGEPVCQPLLQWMRQLSWAIPITTVYEYLPRLAPKVKPQPQRPAVVGNPQLERMGQLVLNCRTPKSSLTQLLRAELPPDDFTEDHDPEDAPNFDVAMILPHLAAAILPQNLPNPTQSTETAHFWYGK